jgi:ribonucleoside-diphosphate reductase alpha chain
MTATVVSESSKPMIEINSPIVDVSVRPLTVNCESESSNVMTVRGKPSYPLDSKVYRIKPPVLDYAIYITLTCREIDGIFVPYQIFINSKHNESVQSLTGLTRLITRALSLGASIDDIKDDLNVTSESPYWYEQRNYPSVISHIGQILEDYANSLNDSGVAGNGSSNHTLPKYVKCPSCSLITAIVQEGCLSCTSCDYSRCS